MSVRRTTTLALVGVIWLAATFGIALAIAEWRAPDDKSDELTILGEDVEDIRDELDDVSSASSGLESAVSSIEFRLTELESPLPPASRDIQQLYARVNYVDCVLDADTQLENAEDVADDTYAAYLAGNATFAEYSADFDIYERASLTSTKRI